MFKILCGTWLAINKCFLIVIYNYNNNYYIVLKCEIKIVYLVLSFELDFDIFKCRDKVFFIFVSLRPSMGPGNTVDN